MEIEQHATDLLIVGSGFAGLWAAIAAHEAGVRRIAIVDKGAIAMSSQSRMCAGATIYCLPDDDADLWLRDLVEANGFLSRQRQVAEILEGSSARLRRLEEWGVAYSRRGEEYLRLPSRGLPHVRMMVMPRYRGRVGGTAVVDALRRRAALGTRRRSRLLVTNLLRRDGRVAGALAIDRTTARPVSLSARAVLLATADCSFRGDYVCTDATTGDGFRLAYDQGVRLSNMEFLCVNTGSPRFGFEGTGLALKWGGRLLNALGEPFMTRHHPDGDAAEIHELVRAMAREAEEGRGPPFHLDMGDAWRERIGPALRRIGGFMPINLARLEAAGVDLAQPQEWVPAVQGLRGGVRVGADGQSDLPGLFAAGMTEALDPGLFNGWSTMRAMGSGERSGQGAAAYLRDADPVDLEAREIEQLADLAVGPLELAATLPLRPDEVVEHMQAELFRPEVSILKTGAALAAARAAVEALRDEALPRLAARDAHELCKVHETRNMVCVAEMYLLASLARTESRASHFRADYPQADDPAKLAWINLRRSRRDEMLVESEPVPLATYPVRPKAHPAVEGPS